MLATVLAPGGSLLSDSVVLRACEPIIHNYAEWQALPEVARDFYAMEMWDGYTSVSDFNSLALALGIGNCTHDHGGLTHRY